MQELLALQMQEKEMYELIIVPQVDETLIVLVRKSFDKLTRGNCNLANYKTILRTSKLQNYIENIF